MRVSTPERIERRFVISVLSLDEDASGPASRDRCASTRLLWLHTPPFRHLNGLVVATLPVLSLHEDGSRLSYRLTILRCIMAPVIM